MTAGLLTGTAAVASARFDHLLEFISQVGLIAITGARLRAGFNLAIDHLCAEAVAQVFRACGQGHAAFGRGVCLILELCFGLCALIVAGQRDVGLLAVILIDGQIQAFACRRCRGRIILNALAAVGNRRLCGRFFGRQAGASASAVL